MISLDNWSAPDEIFSSDARLKGLGAISRNQFFHAIFPEFIIKLKLHIKQK
jgi:hypothetical protein